MSRREQTAALLADVEQYLGCKGTLNHRRGCPCRNGIELLRNVKDALHFSVLREMSIRDALSTRGKQKSCKILHRIEEIVADNLAEIVRANEGRDA